MVVLGVAAGMVMMRAHLAGTMIGTRPLGGTSPVLLATMTLSACASIGEVPGEVAQGSAIGAAAGAAAGAVVPGVNVIEGAAVGAAIGGLAGAVWADQNNDGYVDGYVSNGQYYTGTPRGYDPTLRRVVTGGLASAGGGLTGAISIGPVGSPVGGLSGAIWADRDNDGRVDGFVYKGQYYATASRDPAYAMPVITGHRGPEMVVEMGPPAEIAPGGGFRAADRSRARATSSRDLATASPIFVDIGNLASVRAWHSANGALTRGALDAFVQECNANWSGVGPECQAGAREGAGAFRTVPESARIEFAFLVQQGCPADRPPAACIARLESNRLFRSLPRGRLDPKPLTMNEGVRTRFTAYVLDRGRAIGMAGAPADEGVEVSATGSAPAAPVTLIPMTSRMCFSLRADDPAKVRIEPVEEQDATLEGGRICMDVAEGGGALKFDPSWFVTPMTGHNLNLYLDTLYFVGQERRTFEHQPRPLVIRVIPKPTLWERINAWLKRSAETVGLATNLAKGIGALMAAIAGWGIWTWLRGRRATPSAA